jgi:hypothetical protein
MPQLLRPLRIRRSFPLLLSFFLSVAAAGLLSVVSACSSAAQVREQCALDAVRALPLDDPDSISVGDARALGKRIQACISPPAAPSSPAAPDAGG